MKHDASYRAHLATALITSLLMLIILGAIMWSLELPLLWMLPVVVALALWPISLMIYGRGIGSMEESTPPVGFALIGWLVISGTLLAVNYLEAGAVTWAIYPTIGAALWPVSMYLYRVLLNYYNR